METKRYEIRRADGTRHGKFTVSIPPCDFPTAEELRAELTVALLTESEIAAGMHLVEVEKFARKRAGDAA